MEFRIHRSDFVFLFLCLSVLLAGCNSGQDQQTKARASVLHIQLDGEPSNIDPAQANDEYGSAIVRSIFQRLYRYRLMSDNYELIPELAVGPPEVTEDLTHYRIQIRPGHRFSDSPFFSGGTGREVKAHDIVYSIKRHFDPATKSSWRWLFRDRIVGLDQWGVLGADYDQAVAGLRAVDDYTLEIQLTAPFPPFLDIIATSAAAIVPREVVEGLGPVFSHEPVGSGAYVLTELNSAGARLLANPNHAGVVDLAAEGFIPSQHDQYVNPMLDGASLPVIGELQLSFVVDDLPSWLLLNDNTNPSHYAPISTASIDLAFSDYASLSLKPEVAARLIVEPTQTLEVVRLDLNLDGPLGMPDEEHNANDLRALRCAIVTAMDWESRNKIFYHGVARIFPGVIPPGLSEFDPDQNQWSITLDREGARERLAKHNWNPSNLPKLRFGIQAGVVEMQGFEHSRAMLMELGWPGEKLIPVTFASFGDVIKASRVGSFDIYINSWKLDYPDAENTLGLYYGPNAGGINFSRYRNEEFDAQYVAISKLAPGEERTAIIHNMNQMLIEECLFIGTVARQEVMAWHKNLRARPREGIRAGTWWQFADFQVEN